MKYKDKSEHHRHQCNSCQTIWEHHDWNGHPKCLAKHSSHECPNCGECQYDRYNGYDPPDCYHGAEPPHTFEQMFHVMEACN